jgi:hypothetical protein
LGDLSFSYSQITPEDKALDAELKKMEKGSEAASKLFHSLDSLNRSNDSELDAMSPAGKTDTN